MEVYGFRKREDWHDSIERPSFRHFPDKRELLVAGQETLSRLLAEGIAEAPVSASPLEAVAAGLEARYGSRLTLIADANQVGAATKHTSSWWELAIPPRIRRAACAKRRHRGHGVGLGRERSVVTQ